MFIFLTAKYIFIYNIYYGNKEKYISSNDGILTLWRHHTNKNVHNLIKPHIYSVVSCVCVFILPARLNNFYISV